MVKSPSKCLISPLNFFVISVLCMCCDLGNIEKWPGENNCPRPDQSGPCRDRGRPGTSKFC